MTMLAHFAHLNVNRYSGVSAQPVNAERIIYVVPVEVDSSASSAIKQGPGIGMVVSSIIAAGLIISFVLVVMNTWKYVV